MPCWIGGKQTWAYNRGAENWQSLIFTVVTLSLLVYAMVVRSERDSVFTIGGFTNPMPLRAVALT